MIDSIPAWFGITGGAIALAWWLVIEYRHAAPDPYVDEPSALDELQRTGTYPHG